MPTDSVRLSIDRTNWQWGKSNINFLMLSVCYKGIAVPLYWVLLDKKGVSKGSERVELVKQFINTFGADCIDCIYGDREFIGPVWISYLYNNDIPFVMRIRNNMKLNGVKASKCFENQPLNQAKLLDKMCNMYDVSLYVWGMRIPSGDTLIVLTNNPCLAIEDYALRWEIETLFGCLKSRGFNLEATHMTDPERLHRLMCVTTLAFAWAHKSGEIEIESRPIRIKKDGRKAHSIFQRGLETIRIALIHRSTNTERLNNQLAAFIFGFRQLKENWL